MFAKSSANAFDDYAAAFTAAPPRILVVDDDPSFRGMMLSYLEEQGLRTAAAAGRQETLRQIASHGTDLVLLDLKLGQDDGLQLLREVRASSNVPVIISTGSRLDEVDRVVGLELGADDYVTKPFGMRELLARVRAVLRRDAAAEAAPRPSDRGRQRFGGWELDRRLRRLSGPDGAKLVLTKGEYALLTAFLDAPQRPLTREQLLQATRVHEDVFDRSIDVQILRLRRKLETDPSAPRIIQTERGIGYVFALTVEIV